MWLDPSTVKTIFLRLAKDKLDEENQRDVKKLAMDEIALKKRHKQFALVISDLERHCVIAVLPSRDKESLEQWLSNLSASKRKAIEIVSIDMWRPYFYAVKAKLPHARVIADRFHVVKQLNENITKLRRTTQRKSDKKVNGILKGSRWLLVKNRQNLSPKEEAHLHKVLDISSEIREAYLLKEEFRNIFEKIKNVEQAKRFLAVWILKAQKTGSRYLAKFVRTLQNWWEEILRYFEEGITNAFSEGINRAIRSIINRAYGYRNFDNFRLQVLAQHGYAHSHHANSR
jgi:transposase